MIHTRKEHGGSPGPHEPKAGDGSTSNGRPRTAVGCAEVGDQRWPQGAHPSIAKAVGPPRSAVFVQLHGQQSLCNHSCDAYRSFSSKSIGSESETI